MNRIVLVTLGLALCPAAASAQQQGWAAKLFNNGVTHNFGVVPQGSQLNHKFTITNIYDVPLQVTGARVSCGCTSVKTPPLPIQPRETAELEIHMDGRKFIGPKTVYVYVSVSTPAGLKPFGSQAVLTVSATTRGDVTLNPVAVNFGAVPLGQTPKQVIDVLYTGPNPNWAINGVVHSDDPLTVTVNPLPSQPGRIAYRVTVQLNANAPAGELKHEVQLQTNDGATQFVGFSVEGLIMAPLTVTPAAVNLGNVKVGESVSRRVVVRGSGAMFKVVEVAGQGDGLTVKIPPPSPNPVQIVTLEFTPTKAGPIKRTLEVKTDLASRGTATVVVEGNAIQ